MEKKASDFRYNTGEATQVSMNLTDYSKTAIYRSRGLRSAKTITRRI